MNGSLFAILGAVSFAINAVFTRRAVVRVKAPAAGVFITLYIAIPFFVVFLLSVGRLQAAAQFQWWQGYAFLVAAGIVHFVIGRSFNYACVQLVGANVRSVLTSLGRPSHPQRWASSCSRSQSPGIWSQG